jgi:hypothetical protein
MHLRRNVAGLADILSPLKNFLSPIMPVTWSQEKREVAQSTFTRHQG